MPSLSYGYVVRCFKTKFTGKKRYAPCRFPVGHRGPCKVMKGRW
jgi:hypothetical protein